MSVVGRIIMLRVEVVAVGSSSWQVVTLMLVASGENTFQKMSDELCPPG